MRRPSSKGFTLIELLLSMTFISVLLLSIAFVAIQTGRMYNRGLVLRSVNQAGREVSDTLRRDFLQTDASKISTTEDGSLIISVKQGSQTISERFCLGGHSYVWNYAAALNDERIRTTSEAIIRLSDREQTPVTLARVIDQDGALCKKNEATGAYPNRVDPAQTTQLLKSITSRGEVVVAVHRLTFRQVAGGMARERLYGVRLTLGTSEVSEITVGGSCRPPDDDQSNQEFCAINTFDMIVRTNG